MTEVSALYRKYRPQTFSEVRDQEQVVSVLEGAIKKGKIPHALLFSGTRGTGKTTLARIFAKEIGTKAIDLYEIDAASNRGIDDIRELKEAVHTLPYESKYKVYIIDEVHMLTKEAFNALLKTLEEPPEHVIFILATTEEEKLLDTILSRCLVFRFNSPSRAVLVETVIDVAKKEGFTLEKEAADLIALSANGSFRDALGVTQKVIMASGKEIGGADEVAKIVGAPRLALILDLISTFQTKDKEAGLEIISKLNIEKIDPKLIIQLLLEYIRIVMILRNSEKQGQKLLENYGTEVKTRIQAWQESKENSLNSHLLLALIGVAESMRFSPLPLLPLEIAFIKHCGG